MMPQEENEDYRPEENDQETTEWPPYKYALTQLKERGCLRYGQIIEWPELEELINRGSRREWPFLSQYMSLTDALKHLGFLVTQRGMNDQGIRILEREEMAEVIKNREYGKANDSLRNSLTLSKVPRKDLQPHEVKKLDHWETKSAVLGATAKILLRKRSLPAPNKVIQSVKKLSE